MTTQTHSTTKEYKQFFTVFKKLTSIGHKESRQELVYQFTSGRTESLRDLTTSEYKSLVYFLNESFQALNQKVIQAETNKKRKVIALFCQMGYKVGAQADINRINAWCISHGHLKKRLNYYSGADLNKLVTQAELVYKSFIQSV